MVAKPLRAALLCLVLDLAYLPAILYDGASLGPAYAFTAAAAVGGGLACWSLYSDCKFQAAVQKSLAGVETIQEGVGLPVRAAAVEPPKAVASAAKKEMV